MTQVVNFQEIDSANGKKIAVITLNSPKSLNALGMDMIALIYPKLQQWQRQDDIVAVFLQGEGEKAFCAGGDIVYMYNDIIADKGNLSPGVENIAARAARLFLSECVSRLCPAFVFSGMYWGAGNFNGDVSKWDVSKGVNFE